MKINKLVVVILFLFLLVQGVFAVGVAPSSKEITLFNSPITYSIRIFNEGGQAKTVALEVTGNLAEYVSLNKQSITFVKGQTQEDLNVLVTPVVGKNLTPGDYVVRIVVKEEGASKGEITALVGISSRLLITIPGEGVNLYSSIFIPTFVNGEQNLFSVEVANKGNKVAEDCSAILTVYSSLNSEIITLLSEHKNVPVRSAERIGISWTPNVPSGNYLAKAKITCKDSESTAEQAFSVGSPSIRVSSLSSDAFVLGTVSQFSLVATSEWGENISGVYANVDLEKEGTVINSFTTESKDFKPRDTVLYNIFLNTKGVAPGNYMIFIRMNYLGKESETIYKAYLSDNEAVLTSLTGNVIKGAGSGVESEKSSSLSILIMAISVVVILNVILVVKLLKRKKKAEK